MENAGRAPNASWFDVAHRVLQGLHSRGIVNYSIPRLTAEQVIAENQRLELQVTGLQAQLTSCQTQLNDAQGELSTCANALSARSLELLTCNSELAQCREGSAQE